jgi:hypothetical protein
MLRSVIGRKDFHIDWEPSPVLLARGVEQPLLGPELNTLLGREHPSDPAILLVRASNLAIRDLAGLGYGPDDLVPLAWVTDAGEAVGVARGLLCAGDVVMVTETMVPVGPHLVDVDGWRPEKVGPFVGQARAFAIEVDTTRERHVTEDPTGFDRRFLDLEGIAVDRDDWAGRDLIGEDLARWRSGLVGAGSDERREIASPDGAQSSR